MLTKRIVVIILQYIFISNQMYTLNLYNVIYQLYLHKTGKRINELYSLLHLPESEKKKAFLNKDFYKIREDRDNVCGLLVFPASKRMLNKYLSNE